MARRPTALRKRRTREHVIADLSVNYVERQALLCGHTVERWLHDYGTDLVLLTYSEEGETEAGYIGLQIKATDRLTTIQNGRFVTIRIERADLRAWLTEPFPFILIVYDAPSERAYWLYVQAAFPGEQRFRTARGSERLTLRIPSAQLLDRAAIQRFRMFRDNIKAQSGVLTHHD